MISQIYELLVNAYCGGSFACWGIFLDRALKGDAVNRFLSNAVNKVDKKGRVSIPASFRPILGDVRALYTLMSVDQPTVDAGGVELIERHEAQLEQMNPLSREYELYSFVLHGDSDELKIDGEGRVLLTDAIRLQTGITDRVCFVGRGHFFQIWEPDRFLAYRDHARKEVAEIRRNLGSSK